MPGGANAAANDAIAGLLLLARAFPQRLRAQREHRWLQLRREQAPADVEGQTVLIIGVGAVGAVVARFAQAMKMHVIGVRRSPRVPGEPVDEMHAPLKLEELLPRAQWVVLACPHGAQTHHLLEARRLALLPRGAGLINVSHADLLDEAALIAALNSGGISGAYLAAFGPQMPAADSPLRAHPNVMFPPVAAI